MRAVVVALLLMACAHNPVIPDPPLSQPSPICSTAKPYMWAGSCGGKRTADRYECVICQTERACVDSWAFTYCVGQAGCDDPRCVLPK